MIDPRSPAVDLVLSRGTDAVGGLSLPEPDLRDDEAFLQAEAEALAVLHDAGVWDPQRWVFGEEREGNLRFSGGAAIAAIAARGLMPGT